MSNIQIISSGKYIPEIKITNEELEKIINTKTPFVQKEDIITKEPKSVVDLVFQDLPKTNIINDDKLLSPIEVSEYIFKPVGLHCYGFLFC